MTGEQIPASSSPREGEDVSITSGRPKVNDGFMSIILFACIVVVCFILGRNGWFIQQFEQQPKNWWNSSLMERFLDFAWIFIEAQNAEYSFLGGVKWKKYDIVFFVI